MSRNLTSAFSDELNNESVTPILLAKFEFSTGTERMWTGMGDLNFDDDDDNVGETYKGVGDLINISEVTETEEVKAEKVDVTLSGIPSDLISDALGADYQFRPATIWLGFLNDNDNLINDPYIIFKGQMDVMDINEGGEKSSITVRCESRLVDLKRPREQRYTDEEQQEQFNGDVGLEYVSSLQDKELKWGKGIKEQDRGNGEHSNSRAPVA